jgi:hypothetical protein
MEDHATDPSSNSLWPDIRAGLSTPRPCQRVSMLLPRLKFPLSKHQMVQTHPLASLVEVCAQSHLLCLRPCWMGNSEVALVTTTKPFQSKTPVLIGRLSPRSPKNNWTPTNVSTGLVQCLTHASSLVLTSLATRRVSC